MTDTLATDGRYLKAGPTGGYERLYLGQASDNGDEWLHVTWRAPLPPSPPPPPPHPPFPTSSPPPLSAPLPVLLAP